MSLLQTHCQPDHDCDGDDDDLDDDDPDGDDHDDGDDRDCDDVGDHSSNYQDVHDVFYYQSHWFHV